MSDEVAERLSVSLEPEWAGRRDTPCEAIVVTDPVTHVTERYEVSDVGRHADPSLLREAGREWFVEEHGDEPRASCPECGTDGEAIEESAGRMRWGCPACRKTWWGGVPS